ncbi:flagellar biosynthetic protein FliO [Aliikangiella sp. IMCC44359]|uniref:flagellar biosynthetic protein FliO n=1 Tax=Aliikangiella sp. IMCC44359 TaxID=3459125 RepID=UPI00403AABF7
MLLLLKTYRVEKLNNKINFFLSVFLLFSTKLAYSAERVLPKNITPQENIVSMLLGLSGILIVIFLLALLIKKFTSFNLISKNIKVIETQSLGAKEKLVIVDIQNKQYVLGVTPHTINSICELEKKIEKQTPNLSFDNVMKQLLNPTKNFDSMKGRYKQQKETGSTGHGHVEGKH